MSTNADHEMLSQYSDVIPELFAKYCQVIEDLWIERQCCRKLLVEHGVLGDVEIDSAMDRAKLDPQLRQLAVEHFAAARDALTQFGRGLVEHLAASPNTAAQK